MKNSLLNNYFFFLLKYKNLNLVELSVMLGTSLYFVEKGTVLKVKKEKKIILKASIYFRQFLITRISNETDILL